MPQKAFFILFLAAIVTGSPRSWAQNDRFPNTRLSAFQTLYSGENNKSFSKTGRGYGGEITSLVDSARVPFYVKGRATYTSGEQTFLDGTTEITSAFTYYQGMLELGLYAYPIPRRKSGFNIFFSAGGSVGYNYISLDNSLTLSSLQYSDQAISTGYAASVGGEFVIGSNSSKKWALIGELTYRYDSGNILGQSPFNLNGVTMTMGLGW